MTATTTETTIDEESVLLEATRGIVEEVGFDLSIPHDHLPVFVYGTLMPGYWNHRFLEPATDRAIRGFVPGAVVGAPHPNAGYPAMVLRDPGRLTAEERAVSGVHGVVLYVDLSTEEAVAGFLGAHVLEEGSGYYTTATSVSLVDGAQVEALTWAWPEDLVTIIPGGRWVGPQSTREV